MKRIADKLPDWLLPLLTVGFLTTFSAWVIISGDQPGASYLSFLLSETLLVGVYLAAVLYFEKQNLPITALISALAMLLTIGNGYQTAFESGSHALHLCLSLSAAAAFYLLFRRRLVDGDKLFRPAFAAVIALLLINLIFGKGTASSPQSRLWIYIGGFSLQPMEFIRVALVLLAAVSYRSRRKACLFLILCGVCVLVSFLLHDLGSAALGMLLLLLDSYLLLDSRALTAGLILGTIAGFILMVLVLPYARMRLEQTGTALESIGNNTTQQGLMIRSLAAAGLRGSGLGKGLLEVPLASNDLACANVQAALGLAGALLLFGSYFTVASQACCSGAPTPASYLIVLQISLLICAQAMLNYLGGLDVLPFTGICAVGVSSGGSSLLAFGGYIGLMLAALAPKLNTERRENG